MRILLAGDTALLIELASQQQVLALYRALESAPLPAVHEMVPAARTLLLQFRPESATPGSLAAMLRQRWAGLTATADGGQAIPGRIVEIPVLYNGEDLSAVADCLGLSEREVIERHTGQRWQAAFGGFAPGFVYLTGGDPLFNVPRRPSPRTRVPAGSVALAGEYTAVYPSASPGGWQLIGVTAVPMWDLQRTEPAYIQPGFQIQFIDAGESALHISLPAAAPASEAPPASRSGSGPAIEFEQTGLQALIQDGGRAGLARLGVSPSGALDRSAMRAANRIVGNPVDTPVVESLLGGLRLRSHGAITLGLSGAELDLLVDTAQGHQFAVAATSPIALDDGDCLVLGMARAGVRCYIAVRGGWELEPVLGSCASDTLSGLGPPPLRAGQIIPVNKTISARGLCAVELPAEAGSPLPQAGDCVTLDIIPGPRDDWFTAEALELLQTQPWQVSAQSNRIGIRLEGAQALTRSVAGELLSEGTVTGAIQVPANGQPVLFLADHPVTGGYPVIATLAAHHLDLAAQIPVGCFIRFKITRSLPALANTAPSPEETEHD